MKTTWISFVLISFLIISCSSETSEITPPQEETIYFPPISSDDWETVSPTDIGWNTSQLSPLANYLEEKNSKSFIILQNGKIVVEFYFNGHTSTTPWYWASAGKTLTSTVVGIAQDEGLLNINNEVSDYLGTGWTSAPLEKENLIACTNLLDMTSGLDDTLEDGIAPENLHYVADAGKRWAYHNVFLKLQDVVARVSSQNWNSYFNSKLRDKIGMDGTWVGYGNLNVYASTTRSMARFGLLIYAKGKWKDSQIVSESFLNQATNTSQDVNKAYGYLWWLNGKSSYHLPQTQLEFQGSLIANAPADLVAALGKNDQKIYIVPSKKLVVIRMGEAADVVNFGLSDFDDELWTKINALTN